MHSKRLVNFDAPDGCHIGAKVVSLWRIKITYKNKDGLRVKNEIER